MAPLGLPEGHNEQNDVRGQQLCPRTTGGKGALEPCTSAGPQMPLGVGTPGKPKAENN